MPSSHAQTAGTGCARLLAAAVSIALGCLAGSAAAAEAHPPVGGCTPQDRSAACTPAAADATAVRPFAVTADSFTPKSAFVAGHRLTIFTETSDVGPIFRIARIGNDLWFTQSRASQIVKMRVGGFATTFALPAGEQPHGIAAGPNGKAWFSEFENNIGKIGEKGAGTEYDAGFALQSNDIKRGSDGAFWFPTDFHGIGRITLAGVITFFDLPNNNVQPATITLGEDGNIWFVESDGVGVGKITPQGVVTVYPTGFGGLSARWGIVQGPDHRIWFTDQAGKRIGAIRLDGTGLQYYSKGISGAPLGLVTGPDGNLYFAETDTIGRITPTGHVTEFPIPAAIRNNKDFSAYGMAVGPDGNIWFVNSQHSQVGKLKIN